MSQARKVEVRGLGKDFASRGKIVRALDGAEVGLSENEFVSLIGTSGCGKSTLLSILAGLQEPSRGAILLDGRPIEGPGRDRGLVFQSYTLFPWLTAQANVEFALRGNGMPKRKRRDVARAHLRLVGLESFADSYPTELSGGMKQRVAIARALAYRPEVLLMDEPFGALDALTRQVMQELLTSIWEQHKITVLFVTHDVEEAVYVSDRALVMTNPPGRIKEEIEITLPRPRSHDMLSTPEFAELYGRVLESIRSESLESAGFGAGP